ncbi:MAG: hypothetical protein E3J87_05945 [Candidatus Cloacimonadota bacterium]|nr:MAG: hypothetical protein E3J87_05945 [Candidatus Cloacimonadota bacterium]
MTKEIKVLLIFVLIIILPTSLVNASDVFAPLPGDLCAWGNNNFGQLGDSTTMPRWKPVQVHEITSVIAFSGGYSHSLAIRASDSTVWAWGWNERGQLGNGITNPAFLPCEPGSVLISGGFTAVEAGGQGDDFSLALHSNGTVWAWGYNGYGQFGNYTTNDDSVPCSTHVENVIAISAGDRYSLALKSDSTVWGWGYNSQGQLGDKSVNQRLEPVQTKGPGGAGYLTGVTAIATGMHHSLALKDDGTVWGWGNNSYGQLGEDKGCGNMSTTPCSTWISDVIAIDAGAYHSIALKSDGTVWSWGYNAFGQMGNNTVDGTNYVPCSTWIENVTAIAAGCRSMHSLAIESGAKAGEIVWAWGLNNGGQLGDNKLSGGYSLVPVQTNDFVDATAIAAGGEYSIAVGVIPPLAVELLSFDATGEEWCVNVSWVTAAEWDNARWIISRSTDRDTGYTEIVSVLPKGCNSNYSHLDTLVIPQTTYYYKLGDVGIDGKTTWHGPVSATPYSKRYYLSLSQSYPNPFNTLTTIKFEVPGKRIGYISQHSKPIPVFLRIYDIAARTVKTLVRDSLLPGSHIVEWDGKDSKGDKVPPGIYFSYLEVNRTTKVKKLILIK